MGKASDRPAVFLDRDGTINVQVGYCGDPRKITLIDGAAEAVKIFNDLGLPVLVITNQSAVARGLITEEQVRRVNAEVALQVARESSGRFDAFYYAPYHPTKGDNPKYTNDSDWRKPGPGMINQGAKDFCVDLSKSFLVGDAEIDCMAGKAAHPELVTFQVPSKSPREGDHQVESLLDAAQRIAHLV